MAHLIDGEALDALTGAADRLIEVTDWMAAEWKRHQSDPHADTEWIIGRQLLRLEMIARLTGGTLDQVRNAILDGKLPAPK